MEGLGAGSGAGGSLVFTGSEDQDVALAKTFWNSVTLQPPLESRLAQRRDSSLDGSSRRSSAARNELPSARPSVDKSKEQKSLEATEAEKRDVKEQYLKKLLKHVVKTMDFCRRTGCLTNLSFGGSTGAKRREEIIALLRKQREERILKESFSNLQKSKSKIQESKAPIPESELEDKESVKALN